ncbi:lipoteichoic acid stability factor AuxA [Macrococcus equipercicus]|uniref:Uncharacterized protein n=1 Tax=Macrococcus equipercicus TaxID=69967 RepID=A0A9Q9BU66_9STAP|nr:hypothetical protein [Macrococcus equipercicus]UTH14514.1 hypothetical protein KFV11_03910 [Macrococcus equipercicus]
MKWFKNNIEVITGCLLGLIFVGSGIFIIFNSSAIVNFKEIAVNKLHMAQLLDFISIYHYAFIKILSRYIHSLPLIYAAILMIYGLGFIYISRLLKKTTQFDQLIAYFYLLSAFFLFLFTAVLMFEVYDIYTIVYFLSFLILTFYVLNRKRLNQDYRKMHHIVLLFFFSVAYILTQNRIYDRLADNTVTPLDVMALNFFFILLTVMGLSALGNYIFLHRATKADSTDELSRVHRKKRDRLVSDTINHQTNEAFEQLSRQSLKADEKVMIALKKMRLKFAEWINLKDEDIPAWMRKPKWFKFFHIELLFGTMILILTFIELNNRSVLFNVSQFNVVKMQYFYEWINLAGLLLMVIGYLFFTALIHFKKRGYFGQLLTVTFLFVKIITAFYLMLFKGINLSLFIPPVIILLVLMITPLFFYHLKKQY